MLRYTVAEMCKIQQPSQRTKLRGENTTKTANSSKIATSGWDRF